MLMVMFMLVIIVILLSSYNAIGGSQYFGKEYLGGILAGMEIENTTFNGAGNQWSQKLHFHTHTYGRWLWKKDDYS
jgi:hypothetical protein